MHGLIAAVVLVVMFAVITAAYSGLVIFVVYELYTYRSPDYSVAITGVGVLDPWLDLTRDRMTLSPLFNLTIRLENPNNSVNEACVEGLSTAVVSYGDAFLGRGTVQQFCSGLRSAREAEATAWGLEVEVPRFLRDRLAEELRRQEAVVNVAVRTPARCHTCRKPVLVCKAKIGGERSSACWETYVHPTDPAAT